jgi:hypothetical protein
MAKAMAECKDLLFKSPVIIKDTINNKDGVVVLQNAGLLW